MKTLKSRLYLLCIVGLAALSSCCLAKTIDRDLLSNWGNFDKPATIVTFNSGYNKPDYDFDAEGRWSQPYKGSKEGFCLPTANDNFGNGWGRVSSVHVNPDKNLICKLSSGGINGSTCQYMALKDMVQWASLSVYSRVVLRSDTDSTDTNINPGDKLVFKVDQIKMNDYDFGNIHYWLMMIQDGSSTLDTKKVELTPSKIPFSNKLEAVVVPKANKVFVSFMIKLDGGTLGKIPSMTVDGAHLYVIRAGKSRNDTIAIPVKKVRSVKTVRMLWRPEVENEYSVASSSDYVVFFCHRIGNYASILKEMNPNIHNYAYFTSQIIRADAGPKDSWYGTSLGYQYVSKNHPEWFYKNGVTTTDYLTVPGYARNYFAKRTDSAFQQAWLNDLLTKLNNNEYSGVLLDEAGPYPRIPTGETLPMLQPYIGLEETQQFLHRVVPELEKDGLDVVYIATDNPLSPGGAGCLTCCPTWVPDAAFPAAQGFTANSDANVPRCRVREWAFLKPYTNNQPVNTYEQVHWLDCIKDMDAVATWNSEPPMSSLPPDKRQMLWMYVLGSDSANDPAIGQQGWLRFVLCSYLIGQNDYTALGYDVINSTTIEDPVIDFRITTKLGVPDGPHSAIGGDEYFRVRKYKPTASFTNSVGGVVVVNASPDRAKTYKLTEVLLDESNNVLAVGSQVVIRPHTGRIFFSYRRLSNR